MDSNYNFDSTLGGSERLPHSANSFKFSTSRSIEIAAMTERILRPSKTKLIFQTLPVHMRRRVMSHNCKRLPRKLREGHMEQLCKSGQPPKQKRPSRKYRRRPTNLLKEYERRQRTHKWLESHIWHAKRFHMTERWGYKLARAPCDKAFRACFRASSAHCLLQDISYFECVQISGNITDIDTAFKAMTNSACGLGVCARAFLSGSREGAAHIYKPHTYPNNYIGKIYFLWKPNDGTETERTLWVFVHPSFSREFYDAALESFGMRENYTNLQKRRKLNTDDSIDGVKLIQLKHKLNRFRLTGPKSHAVVARALKLVDNVDLIAGNEWVQQHGAKEQFRLKEKCNYWNCVKGAGSPGELPAHAVFGAVVKDPRLSRPPKRIKAQLDEYLPTPPDALTNVPLHTPVSPLWNLSLHDKILSKKWTDGQLIKHATLHQLVPGEVDQNNSSIQSVPIILIQRPGSQCSGVKKLGYGCGWDIIIPAGYGLPFWRTFIMFGGRAGGLRETENVARESAQCYLPPDSTAGHNEQQRVYHDMREKYFRLPPNKRVNYIKLGINSPFLCRWDALMKDWCSEFDGNVNVMRNKGILKSLQNCIKTKTVQHELFTSSPGLVPVFIKVIGKGNLSSHAIICLPQADDTRGVKTLTEPQHTDTRERERKLLRKENKALLKKMRRQRVKLKKRESNNPLQAASTKAKLSEYTLKMRELWLPTSITSVRNSCSRQVMGYICQGGFSYTEACSSGVGYIASSALQQLLSHKLNVVLVRNTKSRKYRLATVTVIEDV